MTMATADEHDEGCGCHDHHHGHDHEHHHEHHHHEQEAFPAVSVYTHETATVGSVKCRIAGEYEEALNRLQKCMEETAREVEAAGGLIGHVKAFAKEEARYCMISITDGEDVQRKSGTECGSACGKTRILFLA